MINNDLDIERYRQQLRNVGRVQIPDFLQQDGATQLLRCLQQDVPWSFAETGRPALPVATEGKLDSERLEAAQARAREGFHFAYDRYLIAEAIREGRNPDMLLHAVLGFMNSEQFLAFARYLSGDSSLAVVGGQATRYRPGQFLRLHDDRHDVEKRRYAYVINLSPRWEADWGGLLHFTDRSGQVIETFLPRWNALSLFKVPADHFVSFVAPWAEESRLAITGWWHSA